MATTDQYTIIGGVRPYRQGIRLLGGNVDDQVQINASGAALVAGNYTTGTLAAWIMMPDDTGTYTVLSYGDDNVVEYVTVDVVAGKLRAICCVNTAVQWSFITTNVVFKPHTWYHVAVVQDGVIPKLYVNGDEVTAITRSTTTDMTAWFDETTGIDAGSIGAFEGNGDASLTQEFAGYISDVRVWAGTVAAAALSAAEVKQVYTGDTTVQSTYLLNYWPLDGDALDHGTGADNGTIVGDIIYSSGCEFASRLTFGCGTPLVADATHISISDHIGMAYVIQAS